MGLFGYFTAVDLSCLLLNHCLPRFRYTTTLCVGSVLAAAGFGSSPMCTPSPHWVVLLLVAGLGVSVHLTLGSVLIAE